VLLWSNFSGFSHLVMATAKYEHFIHIRTVIFVHFSHITAL
jgi:hypothetical protein